MLYGSKKNWGVKNLFVASKKGGIIVGIAQGLSLNLRCQKIKNKVV